MPSGSELRRSLAMLSLPSFQEISRSPFSIGHRSGDKVVFCLRRPFHGR